MQIFFIEVYVLELSLEEGKIKIRSNGFEFYGQKLFDSISKFVIQIILGEIKGICD